MLKVLSGVDDYVILSPDEKELIFDALLTARHRCYTNDERLPIDSLLTKLELVWDI